MQEYQDLPADLGRAWDPHTETPNRLVAASDDNEPFRLVGVPQAPMDSSGVSGCNLGPGPEALRDGAVIVGSVGACLSSEGQRRTDAIFRTVPRRS